eukprot:g19507.t1
MGGELGDYLLRDSQPLSRWGTSLESVVSVSLDHRITYVYYEQYLTIVNEGLFNIGLCLIPTFVVCCILLGMDIHSGFLNLITIMMIIVDTVGVMTLWDIQYNAVSLINLVTVRDSQSSA